VIESNPYSVRLSSTSNWSRGTLRIDATKSFSSHSTHSGTLSPCNSVRRTCRKWAVEYREADGDRIYEAIPTWGPHPDVSKPLSRIAKHYPLVILSNAANDQIYSNVEKLGAPFHAVYTAEQAQSYKPRMQAFEYMLDRLECRPEDLLHVSASLRYDLMTAHDMGIKHKVYVNRGYEPSTPYYDYHEVADIGGLAKLLGV